MQKLHVAMPLSPYALCGRKVKERIPDLDFEMDDGFICKACVNNYTLAETGHNFRLIAVRVTR